MQSPNLSPEPNATTKDGFRGDPEFNPSPQTEEVTIQCPRCQAKLIDPSGLGWCKTCGFCKSLEDDKARVPLQKTPSPPSPSVLGLVEFLQVVANLPSWVWVLLGGIATIIAMNVPPSRSLPEDSAARLIWSAIETIIGVALVILAQSWALCVLAPGDDRLSFKDAIIPGRLWGLAMRTLPQTRGQIWLAGWGVTCILSAALLLGGITQWINFLSKTAARPPVVEKAEK